VCVSLLGTWQGKGSETWSPESNLLQVLVSIQGLILVREPYFNEAGYEKQKGAQQGSENSRMYNEMAVLKLVQSMTKLIKNPQFPFRDEIKKHFRENGGRLAERLLRWKALSTEHNKSAAATPTTPGTFARLSPGLQELPDFPLVPASRGFCLTLDKSIKSFQEALAVTVMPVEMELPLD
jgi:ubiquitin-conjugating enzyme E2 O